MTPENIRTVIHLAYTYVQREVDAIKTAMKTMPAVYNAEIGPKLKETTELLLLLDEAEADMETLLDTNQRVAERLDLNIRRQKQWRIMACKACIGGINIDDVIKQAFFDFIAEPKRNQELDDELKRLADQLEQLEKAQNEFGPLREIMLR